MHKFNANIDLRRPKMRNIKHYEDFSKISLLLDITRPEGYVGFCKTLNWTELKKA